jgi:hypothetical protein
LVPDRGPLVATNGYITVTTESLIWDKGSVVLHVDTRFELLSGGVPVELIGRSDVDIKVREALREPSGVEHDVRLSTVEGERLSHMGGRPMPNLPKNVTSVTYEISAEAFRRIDLSENVFRHEPIGPDDPELPAYSDKLSLTVPILSPSRGDYCLAQPANVRDHVNGVVVSATAVVANQDITAIRLDADPGELRHTVHLGDGRRPPKVDIGRYVRLTDGTGRSYKLLGTLRPGYRNGHDQLRFPLTLKFEPLPADTTTMTLEVTDVVVRHDDRVGSNELDALSAVAKTDVRAANLQPGPAFPIGARLALGAHAVDLVSVENDGYMGTRFNIKPVAPASGGTLLDFATGVVERRGPAEGWRPFCDIRVLASGSVTGGKGGPHFRVEIPNGKVNPVTICLARPRVSVRGPWRLRLPLPRQRPHS